MEPSGAGCGRIGGMTQMIAELRQALVAAGAPEEQADAAAASVAGTGEAATKADLADLRGDLREGQAQLEARLTWRLVGVAAVILAALALDL